MFLADRDTALRFIDALGAPRCAYGTWPDGSCDCKYGWTPDSDRMTSEHTGCPELRSLRTIILSLSDGEWERITARGGHTLAGSAASRPALVLAKRYLRDAVQQLERAEAALGDEAMEPIA